MISQCEHAIDRMVWAYMGKCAQCWEANMNEPKMAEEEKHVVDTEVPYIPAVVEQLRLTLKGKNEDYAPTTEFSNFEQAASLVGVSPRLAIMLQIGIKYSRLTSLIESDAEANYEGIRDTLMDLAGYSMIAVAHMDKLSDDEGRNGF